MKFIKKTFKTNLSIFSFPFLFFHSSFSTQVQSYYIAVQGLLVDIQELYGRIQQIEPYLEILGLSIGELPDLSLPPLKIPDLTIHSLFETHSFIHSLTHSLIHSLTISLTHSFIENLKN